MDEVRTAQILELGEDRGQGNLLGIQPWVTPADYATHQSLYTKLAGYLSQARRRDWLGQRTIVVWPEHLGTWLVVAGEAAARQAATLRQAMRALVRRHPLRFVRSLLASSEADRTAAALLRAHGPEMAARYQALFSQLARDYGVTMVAGSIVLPEPAVREDRLEVVRGPLYNVSAVFRPDGSPYPHLVRKVYPVEAELGYTARAEPDRLPVFTTRAGRLGVLICADAWYPASYQRLRSQGAEAIVVPAHAAKPGAWGAPWAGYDGAPQPADVDPEDVGRLTEAEAWTRYALPGRLAGSGARAGMTVFLSGELWDLGAEGASMMLEAGQGPVVAAAGGPALLNLWL